MAAARQAEREIMAGTLRGPLHGVPFGLKDIIDVAGLPTTGHSKVLIDNVAAADAPVTERLKAAGGILMGKLATHEFAIGGPSFDLPWPPAVNPWGGNHFPGGSSSGSGVALAAGMVPAALGTDTGGSVRNPASMCGITGMKPTYGLVSRRGVFPLAYSLDHVGPMTRNVRDNALLLQVLAGHDARGPRQRRRRGARLLGRPRARREGPEDRRSCGTSTPRTCRRIPSRRRRSTSAAEVLRGLGAEVREIRLAPLADYATCTRIIIRCEAFAIHRRWLAERPGDYGDLARQRILDGAAVSAADYIDAQRHAGAAHAAHARGDRRHRCGADGIQHGPDLSASTTPRPACASIRARRASPSTSRASRPSPCPPASPRTACRCRCNSSAIRSRRRWSTASPPPTSARRGGPSATLRGFELVSARRK